MRILYVVTTLGIGGAEKLVLGLAGRMETRGHDVQLLVLKRKTAQEWPTELPTCYLEIENNLFSVLFGLFKAYGVANKYKPDIMHSHTFPANLFSRILQLALRLLVRRCALIATIHNIYEGGWWRMMGYRSTDFLCMQTTAVSEAAAERFVRLGAVPMAKMYVLTNGIEVDEFSHPISDALRLQIRESIEWDTHKMRRKFVWLAAGRVTAAKDYENLLMAFSRVVIQMPFARLWIAGEESDAEGKSLREFAKALRVTSKVHWLGLRRDLPILMHAADAFVLSSEWEGMPLVVGEAMAAGKPVVATDVGGVREIVGECGHVVAPKNAKALALAMVRQMVMPSELNEESVSKARERIQQQFSMESRAKEWESLYDSVKMKLNDSLAVYLAAAVGVVLRLLFFAVAFARTGFGVMTSGDTMSYLIPGRTLLTHGMFVNAIGPEIDRTPGYPFFLALLSAPGFAYAILAQILVSAFSVLIVARIARRIFDGSASGKIATLAAWIFALEPVGIVYSIRLLPETLFVFLFLVALDGLLRFLADSKYRDLLAASFWLAGATYLRPVTIYLPIFIGVGLITMSIVKRSRRYIFAALLLLISFYPLCGVWIARNHFEAGFDGFSAVAAKNLYFYQAAGVQAVTEQRPFEVIQRKMGYGGEKEYLGAHPEQKGWSQRQRSEFETSEAMAILRSHWCVAVWMQLKGAAVVAFTPAAADGLKLLGMFTDDAPVHIVNNGLLESETMFKKHLSLVICYVLFGCCLIFVYFYACQGFLGLRSRAVQTLLIGVCGYLIFVSGGAQAVGRYRLPMMPILCVLAAGGLYNTRRVENSLVIQSES